MGEDTALLRERFLVLAPDGDATSICALLSRSGLRGHPCRDVAELCAHLALGVAVLIVAEDALDDAAFEVLRAALATQEPWSDVPAILLTSRHEGDAEGSVSEARLAALGNVSLLEWPARPLTLLSAARSALRARWRQYDARSFALEQERAVEYRDQFLAMLGHELRNPLAAIRMATDVMLRTRDLDRWAAVIRRQSGVLSRLVDDLLDVSRVTSGRITLERTCLDLVDLVRRCIQAHDTAIAEQELSLTSHLPHTPVWVEGDLVRLEQVLMNLVSNAIKYTPQGGAIAVRVATEGSGVRVDVRDTGVGIAPQMLPRIFELFAQVPDSLDRSRGGLGVGLTVASHLVELHGGSITASSDGPGRGSCFTVRLPIATATRDDGDRPWGPARVTTDAHRILVVEDHADSRELLQRMLENEGHRVTAVADGRAAVEEAVRSHPEIMIVDIGLPVLDGYQVAREVRRSLGGEVCLIALTGYGQPEDRRRAAEAGFDEHLTKPVDPQALLVRIDGVEPRPRARARVDPAVPEPT